MNNDVTGIDQHPIALAHAFDAWAAKASPFDLLDQMIGHGTNLAGRCAGGDNHVIGDGRFAR